MLWHDSWNKVSLGFAKLALLLEAYHLFEKGDWVDSVLCSAWCHTCLASHPQSYTLRHCSNPTSEPLEDTTRDDQEPTITTKRRQWFIRFKIQDLGYCIQYIKGSGDRIFSPFQICVMTPHFHDNTGTHFMTFCYVDNYQYLLLV